MNLEHLLVNKPGTVTRTAVNAVRVKRPACVLDVTFDVEKNTASVLTTCSICGKPATVTGLDADAMMNWLMDNIFIQNAFPARSEDDREILLSGSHGSCFDDLFEDARDEDDEDVEVEEDYDDYDDEQWRRAAAGPHRGSARAARRAHRGGNRLPSELRRRLRVPSHNTLCKGAQRLLVPVTDFQVGELEAKGRTVCQRCEEYVVR
jgi:hypothetical protein